MTIQELLNQLQQVELTVWNVYIIIFAIYQFSNFIVSIKRKDLNLLPLALSVFGVLYLVGL